MKWSELEDVVIDSKVRLHSIYIMFGYSKDKGFPDKIEYHEALGENGAVKDVAKVWENITTLCNYMFEDGTIDINNDLLEIRQMADELQHEAIKHESCKQLVIPCHKVVQNVDLYFKRKGIKIEPQQKHIEASQQANVGNDGELAGCNNKNVSEIEKDKLPTIYDDGIVKVKEQTVLYNAINKGWMELKDNTYSWKKNKSYLALMCGMLYWNDTIGEDKGGTTDNFGEYPKVLKKSIHRFKYEFKGTKKTSKDIQELFGGTDVSNLRSQLLRELGNIPEWNDILNLFPKG